MGSKWIVTLTDTHDIIMVFDTEEEAQKRYDELTQMYWRLHDEGKLKCYVNVYMSRVSRSCELQATDPTPNW